MTEPLAPEVLFRRADPMNKNKQILRTSQKLSLGELILALSSCTRSTAETAAALANLFATGKATAQHGGQPARVRVG
jgi:hypothetical protein